MTGNRAAGEQTGVTTSERPSANGAAPTADGPHEAPSLVAATPAPASLAEGVLAEEANRRAARHEGPELRAAVDAPLPGVGEEMALRDVLRRGGVSMVSVLFLLNLVDEFDKIAYALLGPDIQRSLGLSDTLLAVGGALGGFLVFAAAIPIGYLADRTRRVSLLGGLSGLWAVAAVGTGLVTSGWQLMLARIATGIGKANEGPVQKPLLADAYPLAGRTRIFAIHSAANPIGHCLAPLLAGAVAAIAGGVGGWRWAFIALAAPAVVLAALAFLLREPRRGANEQLAVLGELVSSEGELPISLGGAFARLKKVKTFHCFLVAFGVLGFGFVSAPIFLNLLLENRFGLDAWGRALVDTIIAAGGVTGTIIGGRYGERLFSRAPEKSVIAIGIAVAAFGIFQAVAVFMPTLTGYIAVSVVGSALTLGAFVPSYSIIAAVTPVRLRSMGFATVGIYLTLVGGVGGAIIAGALSDAFGEQMAIALTMPAAACLGGAMIVYGARHVRPDIAAAVADLQEEQEEAHRVASGHEVPILQVRHVDYSYGHVQVLFDVDLEVRRGEVVALLGTNGAGKSTLLRAISGLGMPDRGAVRFEGRTITYAEPVQRVGLGIVQVPGGRAIFPGLTVEENLLLGASSFIWDRPLVRERLDRVFSLFPIVEQRLEQSAGSLSGGEQQMLALARGMLLEPKLLLIDELSLGLAPVVVQQLLETVQRLKDEGVSMVIVEQSINVALALADRAVFMEKGRVRFEGKAADLAQRDDLVRAVFLGGEGG